LRLNTEGYGSRGAKESGIAARGGRAGLDARDPPLPAYLNTSSFEARFARTSDEVNKASDLVLAMRLFAPEVCGTARQQRRRAFLIASRRSF